MVKGYVQCLSDGIIHPLAFLTKIYAIQKGMGKDRRRGSNDSPTLIKMADNNLQWYAILKVCKHIITKFQ